MQPNLRGKNHLRCTIQDKNDLILNEVFFPLLYFDPPQVNESKNVKYFIIQYFKPS
jgi:hypothetical protein